MPLDRVLKRFSRLFMATALLALLLAPGLEAAPTRVPGTAVIIDPPPGFGASARFPGFEDTGRAASIIVTELPGPAAKMQEGMTSEALASRGMTLLRTETVKVDGKSALLLHVSQSAAGTIFLKWMLVAGDAKKTVMVVGAFPQTASELTLPIRRSLLSVSWSGTPRKADAYEGLAFHVDATPKLKLAGRAGGLLIFTETGTMQPSDAAEAMLVVGNSISDVTITNVETFARLRASKTTRIAPLRNIQGRALKAGGLPGYELIADTNDAKSGLALRMYQLVLADRKDYYLAQGFVTADRGAEAVTQFRRIMLSFRRVKQAQ